MESTHCFHETPPFKSHGILAGFVNTEVVELRTVFLEHPATENLEGSELCSLPSPFLYSVGLTLHIETLIDPTENSTK